MDRTYDAKDLASALTSCSPWWEGKGNMLEAKKVAKTYISYIYAYKSLDFQIL